MRVVKTSQLEEGMVTALPVKTKHGQLIVSQGVILDEQLIARISFYGIDCIRIEGEEEIPKKKKVVKELTYSEQVKNSDTFKNFQSEYTSFSSEFEHILSSLVSMGGTVNKEVLNQVVYPLLNKAPNTIEMFDMLHNMRTVDDSIYAHSLNVALISGMFGRWLRLNKEDMDILLFAALLHDIGKTQIPPSILNKPDKYTDEEYAIVKNHPVFGYQMLSAYDGILDPRIKDAALKHHERCDGSGYPNGIQREEIDDFSHIIAIADVYDAMTAARSYRAPLCPFQVIAAFEKEGLQKYHPKYILTFLERIASTYQNNRVSLSDGRAAKIVMLNKNSLSRPIVQLDDGDCIDLSRTPGISIQALL